MKMITMIRTRIVWLVIALLAIFQAAFNLVSWKSLSNDDGMHHVTDTMMLSEARSSSLLSIEMQIRAQDEFLKLLYRNQNPLNCSSARVLFQPKRRNPYDGFALEVQSIGRLLQVAVATDRTLVLDKRWWSAYEPENCDFEATFQKADKRRLSSETVVLNETSIQDNNQSHNTDGQAVCPSARDAKKWKHAGWSCLWKRLTQCTGREKGPAEIASSQPSGRGLVVGREMEGSPYFDVRYYGSRRVIEAPYVFEVGPGKFSLDIIPHWERQFGRFWVRAQIAHYIWRPSGRFQTQIDRRIPRELLSSPFIGFHIRFTDNIKDLEWGFGRNATITRSLDNFMEIATQIRDSHPELNLTRIYLATDNWDFVHATDHHQAEWNRKGWQFFVQHSVQRTSETARMWFGCLRSFAGAAIAADLEILKRADFLVGSYQSNVYRLASELNTAWHVRKYSLSEQRHFSVDVEWFEDP